jgi:hypothetical protein
MTTQTEELLDRLMEMAKGESEAAYMAKRLALGVHGRTLPDDVIQQMETMDAGRLYSLIGRLRNRQATIYDLPRQIVFCLASRAFPRPAARRMMELT